MEGRSVISRKTLGRGASLCDLYDVRQDQFCGSLLSSKPPAAAITSLDMHHVDMEYSNEHHYREKFHKFSIEAGLKISVLSGLLPLSGSGTYLNDEISSEKIVRGTLIYKITTKEDSINLLHDSVRSQVITGQFSNCEATHVVSKIRWGANVIVTFEKKVHDQSKAKEIAGILEATLKKSASAMTFEKKVQVHDQSKAKEIAGISEATLKESASAVAENSGNRNVKYSATNTNKQEVNSFSIKVQGDVVPDDESAPQSLEQVLKLMSMIPKYVSKCNQGKGIPVELDLYPIGALAVHFGLTITEDKLKSDLDLATVGRVESEIDNIVRQKQILNDFVAEVSDFSDHISPQELSECSEYRNGVNIADIEFRGSLKRAILEIRQNGACMSIVGDTIKEYTQNPHSANQISLFMTKKSSLKEKMNFFQAIKEKGVEFVPKSESIETFVTRNDNRDVYVLYFSDKLRNTSAWDDTRLVFLEKIKERNEAVEACHDGVEIAASSTSSVPSINSATLLKRPKFVLVDVALHLTLTERLGHIERYSNGRRVTKDLEKDESSAVTQNIIRWTTISKHGRCPQDAFETRFLCPLAIESKCAPKSRLWVCNRCNEKMQYALGEHFYCDCGGILLQDCEFKCCDPQHGSQFSKFVSLANLKEHLPKSAPPDSINILLLGMTGVGKTTYINAFFNYMEYPTMDAAIAGGVKALIPFQFTFDDTIVQVGEPDTIAEACTASDFVGKSSTQFCRSHNIILENGTKIRIIDTPGIGDVRGLETDKENVEHILQYLANVDQLHGICILLLPDESRLTCEFEYCFKQLLTNLHQHAVNNIMFCYTHAEATHYRCGDTHSMVKKLLSKIKTDRGLEIPCGKRNTFFSDSDAFRTLACIGHGMKFEDRVIADASRSWKKSLDATRCMFQTTLDFEPHIVAETISLNDARKLINLLARPMAEIASTISSNIAKKDDHIQKINKACDDELQALELCRYEEIDELEVVPLDYPRTVCTAESCVRIVNSSVEYSTICHNRCYLLKTFYVTNKRFCFCIDWFTGNCTVGKCRCSWKLHKHITYTTRRVIVKKKVESVEKQIAEKRLATSYIVESTRNKFEEEILEWEGELKKIRTASAQFSVFLEANAILTFNDYMGQYLEHMIGERRLLGEMATVKKLEKLQTDYEKEKQFYKELSAAPAQVSSQVLLTPGDVRKEIEELQKLPRSGALLTQQMQLSTKVQDTSQIVLSNSRSTHTKPKGVTDYTGVDLGRMIREIWAQGISWKNYIPRMTSSSTKRD